MNITTDHPRQQQLPLALLTADQLTTLRNLLDGDLVEHRRQLADLEALASALTADTGDDRDREIARLTADRVRDAIVDVEHALSRFEDGTYGTCEVCNRVIPFDRLAAIPAARYCVACPRRSGLVR